MTSDPNTFDFLEVWEKQYEISHYVAPVYKAIADERQKKNLSVGQKLHRTQSGDFIVNNMDGSGSYATQPWVETDEFLTINIAKEVSVQIKQQDLDQTHLPNVSKRGEKMMNRLFNKIDGLVFQTAYQGAGTVLDASALSGSSGDVGKGISVTQANVPNIFAIAETALIAANVDYQASGKWTGQYKIDKTQQVPVAIMSSQVYSSLLLYLGGKTTELGDRISQSGHVGEFMGFNCFVSNALPWTAQLVIAAAPTTGDTVTFLNGVTKTVNGVTASQAVTFKFVTSTTNPGEITLSATNYTNDLNLAAAINAPYTTVGGTYTAFVQSSLTVMQQMFFTNVSATQVTTGTSTASATGQAVNISIDGMGNVPVAASFVSGSNAWTASSEMQHLIFGVSNSMSLVLPKMARFYENFVSSKVAKDYVCWLYGGMKVFADQAPGIIDIQVATSGFTTMPTLTTN